MVKEEIREELDSLREDIDKLQERIKPKSARTRGDPLVELH